MRQIIRLRPRHGTIWLLQLTAEESAHFHSVKRRCCFVGMSLISAVSKNAVCPSGNNLNFGNPSKTGCKSVNILHPSIGAGCQLTGIYNG